MFRSISVKCLCKRSFATKKKAKTNNLSATFATSKKKEATTATVPTTISPFTSESPFAGWPVSSLDSPMLTPFGSPFSALAPMSSPFADKYCDICLRPLGQHPAGMLSNILQNERLFGDKLNLPNHINLDFYEGEDSKTYQIDVELPGVKKSDMTVRVDDNNRLMIEAKKETESTEKKGKKKSQIARWERAYGHISRVVTLPPDADMDSLTAKCDEGVLHITVSRQQLEGQHLPEANVRTIPIQ